MRAAAVGAIGLVMGSSLLCGCVRATAAQPDRDARGPRGGYPTDVLTRVDLQRLVEAGLDRMTAPLAAALASTDPAVRQTAAFALASVQDSTTRTALEALLADAVPDVRLAAAFALGQLGSVADAAPLIRALHLERDSAVRTTMLEAAGKVADAAALTTILDTWREPVPADRLALAIALYHAGRRGVTDRRGATVLSGLITASDEETAVTAALALAAPRDLEAWGDAVNAARAALPKLRSDSRTAGPLLGILGRHGDIGDVEPLIRWLTAGGSWTTRVAAANALSAHSAAATRADVAAALIAALDDASPHVAVAAAAALTRVRADPAAWVGRMPALMRRPPVAAALLPALVGTPHERLILEWARGNTAAPRSLAWPALARVSAPAADTLLIEGFMASRREAYVAASALAQRLADRAPGADTALHRSLAPLVARRLALWGAHAPASDVRGVLRLVELLIDAQPQNARELLERAAAHPHPDFNAIAARSAPPAARGLLPRRAVDWTRLAEAGTRPRIELRTRAGSFVVELYPALAPLSVSALLHWVDAGMFDGLTLHRVEGDFILQSGDFDNARGFGGPERGLRSELGPLRFAPGVLGMASAGRDTEGSQYFITHNHARSLDGRYGAVGRIISGLTVADGLALGDTIVAITVLGRHSEPAANAR
jgi:cyclophilin family peptidyl-prolyl cis-trans isomerase